MKMTRREFLTISAAAAGALVISTGISGCGSDDNDPVGSSSSSDSSASSSSAAPSASFAHGVASGDPLSDKVIIWTRATPAEGMTGVTVSYEVAEDSAFTSVIHNGDVETDADRDYTVKVDVQNLTPATEYYYRFKSGSNTSPVGRMKTLASGSLASLTMAVFTCSNYPKGYFNAYTEAAQRDIDVVVHLGDYIYEHGMFEADGVTPAYATEDAVEIGRALPQDNDTELLALDDYRKRYALYHTDSGLQALHAHAPFIVVWDDHEVANDTYKDGAENHQENEGSFTERRAAALQAYFEWLPIRPASEDDELTIYRSFDFGDLVALHMLDTRIIGRDKQLDYSDYLTVDDEGNIGLDAAAFQAALLDTNRTILGAEQLAWLQQKLVTSAATWQVLGQQVVMGRMMIPAELLPMLAILLGDYDETTQLTAMLELSQAITELATIKTRYLMGDDTLTAEEIARVTTVIPYNLDAWDGYFMERETVLATALQADKNLVVLAGDSHNGWANNLKASNTETMLPEYQVGVEFAVTSVTSPGLEEYLGLGDSATAQTFEQVLALLINDLEYCNLMDRGFMIVNFTPEQATCEWMYVDNIKSTSYSMQDARSKKMAVLPGQGNRALVEA